MKPTKKQKCQLCLSTNYFLQPAILEVFRSVQNVSRSRYEDQDH